MTKQQLQHLRLLFYDYGVATAEAERVTTDEDRSQADDVVDKIIDEAEALFKELHENLSPGL